ncbi:hypothetical protein SLEP1_g38912 [Rubroshorea leprosula]|uniref:Uncharacterized protein n=1 Tax=Rubroshorea leprosula TaxID=152421 RepID=A0AAV5KYV8_9ROSI|nr:hypothetical protein SLEP1_g38912 [Rubroshorea leprosula]
MSTTPETLTGRGTRTSEAGKEVTSCEELGSTDDGHERLDVLPGCKKKETKDKRLLSVFSHILGLLDPRGRLTELLPRIPPANARKPVSQASTDDFGAHRMKDTGKNAQV